MKQLSLLFMLLCSTTIFAQDVIVKKDGSTILSKVLEVNQNDVKYKNFNNQDGPTYTIRKSEIQAINYQNGAKDIFSAPIREENRYNPNNQSDGYRQMNDNALINMDTQIQKPLKKAKLLRIIGIAGGLALEVAGALLISGSKDEIYSSTPDNDEGMQIAGIACMVGGVVGAVSCLWTAHNITKNLKSYSLYQQEFNFKNGRSLSPSIDLLRDQAHNNQAIGFGLQYNF